MLPGKTVSVVHQSSTKGRLYNLFGKPAEDKPYSEDSISMHHATGDIHVEQQALWTEETTASRYYYEAHMVSYQSDTRVYCEAAFINEVLLIKKKYSTYSGVGAQHQNGVVERGINTIMLMAQQSCCT
jgi:hypothetical protein